MTVDARRGCVVLRCIAFVAICGSECVAQVGTPAPRSVRSGKELYDASCAACHARDGRGAPRSVVGFDTPLPDFTDCGFATPEADADWFAVTHQGGRVRAFDRRMPAFGEALTDDEISRTIDFVRGFCTDPAWPRGELNLPRPLVTEKAFPENEAVVTTAVSFDERTKAGTTLLYERRIGARNQLEVAIPLEFQRLNTGSLSGGIGDLAAAVKRVLLHDAVRGAIVSAAMEVVLPTGSVDSGRGRGATVFEPYVALGKILPFESFLQAQAGVELPVSGSQAVNTEAFWRAAYGRTFTERRFGRTWTPIVELLGARELADAAALRWDLVPQVQVSLSRRQHVLLNLGVQIPVNAREGRQASVVTYLLWDWFDGGLFDGWR